MATASYTLPNLIQGVSQQSAEQRRPTQCEAQQNCINSPKEGAVARPSLEWSKTISGVDWTNAAFYEIFRGADEHYLAIIPQNATVGDVRVWDLENSVECTVTKDGTQAGYLATGSLLAKDNFTFQTDDDYTFVANKTKTLAMTADVQTTRPPEALVFVKASAYLQTYAVAVSYAGNRYIYTYKTPDNSAPGNAEYIATSAIASALYKAMTGGDAHQIPVGGEADTGDYLGVMGVSPTPTLGTITGSVTLVSLGFSVQIRSNVIRIWRGSDTNDFKIDNGDGTGNTFIGTIKDKVAALNKLPEKAMVGFRVKIVGSNDKNLSDGYYVEFTADNVWQECAGAGIKTKLDKATMPHALINTGFQAFSWVAVDWDTRLVGDDVTAKLPYFVGKTVQDLFFYGGRLGILTEGAYDLSKNRNSFSFFSDTVQLVLATGPISNPLSGRRSISLVRKAVQVDESVFFWAQGAQLRLSTGVEALKPDTAETKIATSYAFAEHVRPINIGADLYFVVEPDDFANLKVLSFGATGKASPEVPLTDHVPSYIKAPVREVFADEIRKMIFVRSAGLQGLYLYNYLVQGANIVQSSWQTWTFPVNSVLWSSVWAGKLYTASQVGSDVVLATMPLAATTDPGEQYHTRLDLRVTEDDIPMTYSSLTDTTVLTLPYSIAPSPAVAPVVVIRITAGDASFIRGQVVTRLSTSGYTLTVQGNVTGQKFYVGFPISSSIELSEFFPRDLNGDSKLFDAVIIKRLLVSHAKTSYYKVELQDETGVPVKDYEFTSRRVGVIGGVTGDLNPTNGAFDIPVEKRSHEYKAVLVNDTHFPSAWQRIKVTYSYVDRGTRDPAM